MKLNSLVIWWQSNPAARFLRWGGRSGPRHTFGRSTRCLLTVFVGCTAAVAGADTGKGSVSPQSGDLFSSKSAFHCAPSPVGKGTWPKLRSNTAGTVAWWYCPSASGGWSLHFAAATAANLSAAKVWDEIYTVMTASDSVAAFHAVVAQRLTTPMDDPSLQPVWQPFLSEMHAGAPARVVIARNALAVD